MAQKTELNKFELTLAFQQTELRYETQILLDREKKLYQREVDFSYAQREQELNK